MRREYILKCWQQKCCNEGEYVLSKWDCFLYSLKAIIAILLGLGRDGKYDKYQENYITVAILSSSKTNTEWGAGAEWEELNISLKWNEWRYVIDFDGYP